MKQDLAGLQRVLVNFMYRRDLTARDLARMANCSLPAVYRRIERLKELGAEIQETKERRNQTGPTPIKYRLIRFR